MLIFDLDGTIWDSSKQVADSWNIAAHEMGFKEINISQADIMSVMGKTMDVSTDIIFGKLGDERFKVSEHCMLYENEYIAEHGGNLFPDVRKTLSALKESGVRMAIVSNCQSGYIEAFLKSMDMYQFFTDFESWGRTGLSKGENIRLVMERNNASGAAYIGDTLGDETASQKAGVPFIHAAYGFGSAERPDYSVNSFSELAGLSRKIPEIMM